MTTRFSEAIRKWAGWCPNHKTFTPVRGTGRYADASVSGTPDREVHAMSGVIVDYGRTGISIPLFIALNAGFAVLIVGLIVVFRLWEWGSLLLMALVPAYSAMELYRTQRRDRIEATRDTITIRRPPFPPIVIPKDAVVKAEVRKNELPVPSWLLIAALAMFLLSAAGGIYGGMDNPASVRFIFGCAAVIFFPAIFYRAYTRTRYPQVLTLTTATKKIAAIYTDDPEGAARMLGVS